MARKNSKTAKKAVGRTAASKKRAAAKKKASAATAKKTPATKKKNASTPGVGAVAGELPYPMKLRGTLHLRFKAAAAEMGEVMAKTEVAKARVELLLSKPVHFEVTRALNEQNQIIKDVRAKRTELAQIQLECGRKLGIKPEELKDFSFDSDTGVVLPIAPPT